MIVLAILFGLAIGLSVDVENDEDPFYPPTTKET